MKPLVTRTKLPRASIEDETATAEAGYSRDEVPAASLRKSPARVTLVERTCRVCGRKGLDVLPDLDGPGALCFSGTGCNTKAYAIVDYTMRGVTMDDIGRARRSLANLERALRSRGSR